jgi:hypothetical protein
MWFFNKEIRFAKRSKDWPALRQKHLSEQPCCAACGSCLKPEVHHIVPVHLDPSRELDPDNLITLCDKYCHFVFGHLMNYRSWNIDIIKDAKVYNDKLKNRPP